MENRIAIIDMGTNTFHLLIAEFGSKGVCITHRERLSVKIGMGGINQGLITEEGIQRAMLALRSFKNTIDGTGGVSKTYAFGTSALRNAKNTSQIVARIKELTDIDVDVISGDKEAEYIYYGVRAALNMEDEKCLIVDIGGGSVEFVIGNNEEIFWKKSLEIGAQRLLEMFQNEDPISSAEINLLHGYFEKTLTPVMEALAQYRPHVLVGSSGTFDTLSDIFCIQHHIVKSSEDSETPLSLAGFDEIYAGLLTKNRVERMGIQGMIEMRVDMIVVACCLIDHIVRRHSFSRIRVSTYSLKEGVLAWLADGSLAAKLR